jgi:hypothetical protein
LANQTFDLYVNVPVGRQMINDIKTDKSLLLALEAAARRRSSAEEVQNQRISFIMGAVRQSEHVTKSRIRAVLADQNGDRRT